MIRATVFFKSKAGVGQCHGSHRRKVFKRRGIRGFVCNALIILAVLFCRDIAVAADIIAVQSINIKPYNDALHGFKEACNCNVKQFFVSDRRGEDIVRAVRKTHPAVILAIGIDALNRVRSIRDVPIVYFMILNSPAAVPDDNITGVSLYINPEKQLSLLRKALPDVNRIGLLYDPARTGDFVRRVRAAAEKAGTVLIAREIHSPKDVPVQLQGLKGKIDAFWMLPDITVVTPDTIELLFLFSFENRIPVITFSDKYLEMGALISFDIDAADIGMQAWEITERILSGTDIRKIKEVDARKAIVTINRKTAKKLGVTVSGRFLNKAGPVER
ncbi:MAG: ABC transporter substrate-binding protein [Deferribacteres bacterium]|nr:ABC transporter substrate-binding protein [Deferribacteres bacterium]